MKRKLIILLIVSLFLVFKSLRAESELPVHNKVITELSEIKKSKDYEFIKKYLKEENDELKVAAIYALNNLNKKSASIDLKNIYAGSSYEIKRNIVFALGEMKLNENIVFLSERLSAAEKIDINNEAIVALAKIDDGKVIPPLINHMTQFPENGYILKQMPLLGSKLIEPLFLNLPEGDENIKNATKIILQKIVDINPNDAFTEIVKLSASEIVPVKSLAKELIEERKEDAVGPAIKLFVTAKGKLREELVVFLSNYPDSYVVAGSLNTVWNDVPDDEGKIQIIDILCNSKTDVLNEFLLCNVINPSERIRMHVLSRMEQKDYFVTEIIKKLTKTDDEIIKSYYKTALIKLGGGNFLTLLSLLANEKYSTDAMDIIVGLDGQKVDERLLDILKDKEKGIDPHREKIRNILIRRFPASLDPIIEGLKDTEKANESKNIILKLGDKTIPSLVNVLKEDADDLQIANASEILLEFGEAAVPDLIKGLEVSDLWSKMNIAELLVELKHKEAIPALIEVMGTDDPGLQYKAIYALRDLGAVSALKENLNSVNNEKVKKEIEKALKKLGE